MLVEEMKDVFRIEKQGLYKRLITGALGVREEDVEGLLPEIVGELEESSGWGAGMEGVVA